MAAAVMRAVTFGLSSSNSTNSDREGRSEGRRSRPSSRAGSRSRSKSRPGGEDDGTAESLSRTSSRLGVPGLPGEGGPRPASILINGSSSTRGYSPLPSPSASPPTTDQPYSTASSLTSEGLALASASSPPSSASRPPLGARQGSDASSVVGPVTPSNASFPPGAGASSFSGTPSSSAVAGQKQPTIRFAPLPEIRPRSYSTGRNVWLEDDPEFADSSPFPGGVGEEGDDAYVVGEDGEPVRRGWVRRDDYPAGAGMDDYALEDDEDEGERGPLGAALGRWGSWTENLTLGLSPSTSRTRDRDRERDDDAVSVTSSVGGGELERTLSGSSSISGVGGGGGGGGGGAGGKDASGSSKKLLKALGFGLGRSSKSSSSSSSKKRQSVSALASAANGLDDDPLSRTSSVDSTATGTASDVLSRRSSLSNDSPAAARPKGSTGIPLRKAATWEAGDSASASGGARSGTTGAPVYYASPARSGRRRANYPPVAQRSRNGVRRSVDVRVEEPAFSEWGGGGGGVGSVGSSGRGVRGGGGGAGGAGEEEDDGSGLAWLKKRRAEREKQKREEEEAAAKAAAAAGQGADSDSMRTGDGLAPPSPPLPAAAPAGAGLTTSVSLPSFPSPPLGPSSPAPATHPDAAPAPAPAPLPLRLGRQPPVRSGTLDSTTSTASTVRPSTPTGTGAPNKSGLAATRPALVLDTTGAEAAKSAAAADEEEEEEEPPTPLSAVSSASTADSALSDDDDEEDDEKDEDEDDDDDLTAEELAREEALAAEAKRGAKAGMGAERYHSSAHENRMLQVSADEQ